MTGSRIGAYQLLNLLGKGGMGSVYAASRADQEYEKIVAIKFISPGLCNEEMLERFRQERQVLADLQHPWIARLFDGGASDDGTPYLVMEFVDGSPIDRSCESRHLSLRDRLRLFQQVCEAVQFAHQHLVIHGDIKPGNILVSKAGVPKLLDFGIARLITANRSVEQIGPGKGDEQLMTLRYASPEQIRQGSMGTSSDQYSLGVVLYELLTGWHPFERAMTGRAEFKEAVLTEEAPKPSFAVRQDAAGRTGETAPMNERPRLSRSLRGDLDSIVLKTLSKQPQHRYASVQSLSKDIANYFHGEPVSARNGGFNYRTGKFIRRHAKGIAAMCLVFSAMVASSIIALRFGLTAQTEHGKAVNRFNDVRKLARFALFDLDDALLLGEKPARKLLVAQTLVYLNELVQDSGSDLELEKEIMKGYLKIGDLQGNPEDPNLRDDAGATISYGKALSMAQKARSEYPADVEIQLGAARVGIKLGDLEFRSDPAKALRAYREAQQALESLARSDNQAKHDLAQVLQKIGSIFLRLGQTDTSLVFYERCRWIAEDLLAANRSDLEALRLIAVCDSTAGNALAQNGKTKEGIERMRAGLSTYRELEASSNEPTIKRDICTLLIDIGDALAHAGEAPAAFENYRLALKLSDALLAADPKNNEQGFRNALDIQRTDLHKRIRRLRLHPDAGTRQE